MARLLNPSVAYVREGVRRRVKNTAGSSRRAAESDDDLSLTLNVGRDALESFAVMASPVKEQFVLPRHNSIFVLRPHLNRTVVQSRSRPA